jgi:hypothetical protein
MRPNSEYSSGKPVSAPMRSPYGGFATTRPTSLFGRVTSPSARLSVCTQSLTPACAAFSIAIRTASESISDPKMQRRGDRAARRARASSQSDFHSAAS